MTRFLIVALLSLGLGLPVHADVLTVRSGEHDRFTRLVVSLPAGTDWKLKTADRRAEIDVSLANVRFDTRQVFQRVPRERLASVSQADAGSPLALQLACACPVSAQIEFGSLLVIDISDPPDGAVTKAPFELYRGSRPYRFGSAAPATPVKSSATPGKPEKPRRATTPPSPAVTLEEALDRALVSNTNTILSQERLISQISRAASQGLLAPRVAVPSMVKRNSAEPGAVASKPASVGPRPISNVSLRASTSVDRDMRAVINAKIQTPESETCLDPALVAVQDWGSDQPFNAQIGPKRAALYQEFDSVRPDAVLDLARTYLFFSFGAEADRVLDLLPQSTLQSRVASALSLLMDDEEQKGTNPLANQSHCDSDVALWSFLSDTEPKNSEAPDTDAIQRAFWELPRQLRAFIGPRLAGRFVEFGDDDTAKRILRQMSATDTTPDAAFDLVEAKVAIAKGEPARAQARLAFVAETNSAGSPEALIETINLSWDAREPIDPAFPDLIAAYETELETAEIGLHLRRAHARSLALTGAFDAGFALLSDIAEQDGGPARHRASGDLLELLAERGDDVTFLRLATANTDQVADDLPTVAVIKLARRFIDAGFNHHAARLLDNADKARTQDEWPYLRAEAALGMNLPHRAQVHLLGLTDDRAATLRAEALLRIGDHARAGDILAELGDQQAASRAFFLGDQWSRLTPDAKNRFAPAANLAVNPPDDSSEQATASPLADAQQLITLSRGARSKIDALLATTAISDDP